MEVKNAVANIPNAVIMTSSKGTEVSSWYPDKKHSMFTYFFLESVKDLLTRGKDKVTADDFYRLITDENEGIPYYAKRMHGRIQTPQIIGDKSKILIGQ
ncbi:MAG: hypothetical protein HQL10_09355 [Nitrospirae bacterium]|nr:hypothetical protein [Nitrospirota bacterium]